MKTNTIKEDKIIGTLAIVGMATILALVILATMLWIDPFFSNDALGRPTIFGRLFVYGIYTAEALAGLVIGWLFCLAAWSFVPVRRKRTCSNHIKHLPLKAAQNITGRTQGVN